MDCQVIYNPMKYKEIFSKKNHVSWTNIVSHNIFLQIFLICFFWSYFFIFILFSTAYGSAQFSGAVIDSNGHPIDKAIVRLQGTQYSALTDSVGHFNICMDEAVASKHITAWKDGYYNGGQHISKDKKQYKIVLNSIHNDDNGMYTWVPSLFESLVEGDANIKPCQQCHAELTEQWKNSTHGRSAINPVFLSFFSGTNINGITASGPAYKLDFPNSNGNCSTCHLPAMALNSPFNSDPRKAQGVEKEGVFCDLCHKISDAHIDKNGGYPGTLSLRFNRPTDGHQLFYGQYDDVFPGDDAYHPIYKDSRYCAPCHNGTFWNVLMYSEFQEWAQSSYASKNIHCQDCHMASNGKINRFALEKEGSVEREPETISSHVFNGIGDHALMREAIELDVKAELKVNKIIVTATVKNVKAGHHYPTGNPMRNMLLLVEARGYNGSVLPMVAGEKVPIWGGIGSIKNGNYSGLPGKGFAKVLRDTISYQDGRGLRHFLPEYPAPHWRPTIIESDNRIPANGEDISRYIFQVPADFQQSVRVKVRLIFRRTYKKWADVMGFAINDLELAQKNISVGR